MYCRGCRYPLELIIETRCPECGRRYDRSDPRTYLEFPTAPTRPTAYAVLESLAIATVGTALAIFLAIMFVTLANVMS